MSARNREVAFGPTDASGRYRESTLGRTLCSPISYRSVRIGELTPAVSVYSDRQRREHGVDVDVADSLGGNTRPVSSTRLGEAEISESTSASRTEPTSHLRPIWSIRLDETDIALSSST